MFLRAQRSFQPPTLSWRSSPWGWDRGGELTFLFGGLILGVVTSGRFLCFSNYYQSEQLAVFLLSHFIARWGLHLSTKPEGVLRGALDTLSN